MKKKTYAKWENETEKKIEWTHNILDSDCMQRRQNGWTRRVKLIDLASLFRSIDWLSSYRGYRRYGLTIHIQFSFITSGFNPRIIKINPILPFENLYPISSLISNIVKILEKLAIFTFGAIQCDVQRTAINNTWSERFACGKLRL